MGSKDWRVLAYLKNAICDSAEKIAECKDREDLIDEVMKMRDLKRSELTLQHILKDGTKQERD